MYLTEIDPEKGTVKIGNVHDGVMAIKEFRDVINNEKLGIECFTCIALTVDYESKISYYGDDVHRKAMEIVTGNRDFFPWKNDLIQEALVKYSELQYDPTREEERLHKRRKVNKLKELEFSEMYYGKVDKDGNAIKLEDENGNFKSVSDPSTISSELRKINQDIKLYEDSVSGKDIYENSPVINGYTLSRLEQKIKNKKSFYHGKRKAG